MLNFKQAVPSRQILVCCSTLHRSQQTRRVGDPGAAPEHSSHAPFGQGIRSREPNYWSENDPCRNARIHDLATTTRPPPRSKPAPWT